MSDAENFVEKTLQQYTELLEALSNEQKQKVQQSIGKYIHWPFKVSAFMRSIIKHESSILHKKYLPKTFWQELRKIFVYSLLLGIDFIFFHLICLNANDFELENHCCACDFLMHSDHFCCLSYPGLKMEELRAQMKMVKDLVREETF